VGDTLTQTGTAAASVLALVLSLVNLYLQRRDRTPRLRIRVRYEYRVELAQEASDGEDPPRVHDDSQEGLYLRLGDFLREHGVGYPQGTPMVRFALSNEGEKPIYLDEVALILAPGPRSPGDRLVLDPTEGKILPRDLARGTAANVLRNQRGQEGLAELVPGDGVGYKFELVRLANILEEAGHTGNVRLKLEATDRLGNVYRRPFEVNTNLWAYPETR
jgi:hypothetical protein